MAGQAAASPSELALASHHPDSDASTTFHGWAVSSKGGAFQPFAWQPRPFTADDVQLRITDCGVCGSDVHCVDGGWGAPAKYPLVPGHELVGVVERVGSAVHELHVGDVCGVGAQIWSCDACARCEGGEQHTCAVLGMTYDWRWPDGQQAQGGYAERWRGPARFCFPIPPQLSSTSAAPLLCAGLTVYAPLVRFCTPGTRVGVVGLGGLGHLALQFARALGHARLTAISRSADKEQAAREHGASHFVLSVSAVHMAAVRRSFDVLLLCAGDWSVGALDSYLQLLDVGGRLVVLGLPDAVRLSLNLMTLVFSQLSVTGSVIGSPSDMRDMLQLAAKHGIQPDTETYPLDKVNDVIERQRQGKVRFRAVLQPNTTGSGSS